MNQSLSNLCTLFLPLINMNTGTGIITKLSVQIDLTKPVPEYFAWGWLNSQSFLNPIRQSYITTFCNAEDIAAALVPLQQAGISALSMLIDSNGEFEAHTW